MKKQMPLWPVFAGALLIVTLVAYFVLIRPKRAEAGRLGDQIAKLETDISAAKLAARPTEADSKLKVADLLDVLRITKQSLGRVLKQLLDEGYIVQKTGNNDRRQRLLYATPKGEALVAKLAGLQTDRITRALRDINPEGVAAIGQFLRAMIDRDDPDKVLEAIFVIGSKKPRE